MNRFYLMHFSNSVGRTNGKGYKYYLLNNTDINRFYDVKYILRTKRLYYSEK